MNRYFKFIIIANHLCAASLHYHCGSEGMSVVSIIYLEEPCTYCLLVDQEIDV
jgi:hypothetical protein